MFKQFVSYLVITSMLLIDVAPAMYEEHEEKRNFPKVVIPNEEHGADDKKISPTDSTEIITPELPGKKPDPSQTPGDSFLEHVRLKLTATASFQSIEDQDSPPSPSSPHDSQTLSLSGGETEIEDLSPRDKSLHARESGSSDSSPLGSLLDSPKKEEPQDVIEQEVGKLLKDKPHELGQEAGEGKEPRALFVKRDLQEEILGEGESDNKGVRDAKPSKIGSWRKLSENKTTKFQDRESMQKQRPSNIDERTPLLLQVAAQGTLSEKSFFKNKNKNKKGQKERKNKEKGDVSSEEEIEAERNDGSHGFVEQNGGKAPEKWVFLPSNGKKSRLNISLKDITLLRAAQGEEDLEGGKRTIVIPLSPPDEFTPEAQVKLRHIKTQDIDGQLLKKQLAAMIGGSVIGLVLTEALVPIYSGSLVYMRDKHGWTFLNEFEEGSLGYGLTAYIITTLLFDAIPRNASLWKKAASYLTEEAIEKGRLIWTGLASLLPSGLEPSYLIAFELYAMHKMGVKGLNNQFAIAMMVFSPFLLIDSFGYNYNVLWGMWDDFKVWTEASKSVLVQRLFPKAAYSKSSFYEDNIKNIATDFWKRLDTTCKSLGKVPKDLLEIIYNTIYHGKDELRQKLTDLTEQQLESAQSFFMMRYLLSLGDEITGAKHTVKSWYETITDGINYTCLTIGSPIRFLVLEVIFENFFGLFSPKLVSQVFGWVCATVGFPFQTLLEYQATKTFFRDFIRHDDPQGHSSHPHWRGAAKTASIVQGIVFTLPLAVLSLEAVTLWLGSPWWMTMGGFFLFSEFTSQVTNFHNSYSRKVVTTGTDLHNRFTRRKFGKEPRDDYKRDRLIRLARAFQGRLKTLDPDILLKLEESLRFNEEEGSLEIDLWDQGEDVYSSLPEGPLLNAGSESLNLASNDLGKRKPSRNGGDF